jgi:starch-binding outer membrane protein SusE/F
MNTTGIASGIASTTSGKVEYRIKATTASGAIAYSSPVAVTITTFSPIPPNLYIVGDATPGGWNNPIPIPGQQFTQNSSGIFQLTLPLTADKSFLFLPVNGDRGHKYGSTGANNANNVMGDNIKAEGGNLKAPAELIP